MPAEMRRRRLAASNPPPVDPASIAAANRVAWWRADSGLWTDAGKTVPAVLTGDAIAAWDTRVNPAVTALQATLANRPTLDGSTFAGRPSLRFTAADSQWLSANGVAGSFGGSNQPFTWIMALLPVSTTEQELLSVGNLAGSAFNDLSGSSLGYDPSRLSDAASRVNLSAGGAMTLAPHVLSLVFDGATESVRDRGVVVTSAAASVGTLTLSSFAMGALYRNSALSSSFFDGYLAELALFNTGLSAVSITQFESYLIARYGA